MHLFVIVPTFTIYDLNLLTCEGDVDWWESFIVDIADLLSARRAVLSLKVK